MTSLSNRIREDALAARKQRSPAAGTLTTLLGEISTREKTLSPPRPLTDEEILSIIRKFLKNIDETETALAARRPAGDVGEGRASGLAAERSALAAYLPQQMSRDALIAAVEPLVRDGLAMGQIMGRLKEGFPGRYDGRLASEVARELLSERRGES